MTGLGIIKLLELNTCDSLTIKIHFERNKAFLEMINNSNTVIALNPNRALAILNIRSLGYYKIQQGVVQQTE